MKRCFFKIVSDTSQPEPEVPGIDLSGAVKSLAGFSERPPIVKRILIVDDKESIRRVVKQIFKGTATVDEASEVDDGISQKRGALKKIASGQYDLIIVDGLDGYGPELVEELRAGGYTGWIAGFSTMGDLVAAMVAKGADWLIPKPYAVEDIRDPGKIMDAITRVLGSRGQP